MYSILQESLNLIYINIFMEEEEKKVEEAEGITFEEPVATEEAPVVEEPEEELTVI
jgi:hypothetical protein